MPPPSDSKKPVIPKSHIKFVKPIVHWDPLPWTDFYDKMDFIDNEIPIYQAGSKGPIILCLHGCGLSALSFAAFANEMKDQYTVMAFDWRGHGASKQTETQDLS